MYKRSHGQGRKLPENLMFHLYCLWKVIKSLLKQKTEVIKEMTHKKKKRLQVDGPSSPTDIIFHNGQPDVPEDPKAVIPKSKPPTMFLLPLDKEDPFNDHV